MLHEEILKLKEERRGALDHNDDESKVGLFLPPDVTSCFLHHEPGCKRHSWPRRVVIARAKRRWCGDEEVTSHGGRARGNEEDSDGAQSWRAVRVTKVSVGHKVQCVAQTSVGTWRGERGRDEQSKRELEGHKKMKEDKVNVKERYHKARKKNSKNKNE